MGLKGNKHTGDAQQSADFLMLQLEDLEKITSKKMFGGHGFFHEGRMFAMVTSKGEIFYKTNETNVSDFESVKAKKHHKMPYYSLPEEIISAHEELIKWTLKAIKASKK
jgi:DNA transformation protein